MKKVLFLGASPFQTPPIKFAKEQGYQVITLDNKPSNPGHTIADVSYDIDIRDIKSVLTIARSEQVSAVVSSASDVSLPAKIKVSQALCLPCVSERVAKILINKEKFRTYLKENGIQQLPFATFGFGEATCALNYLKEGKLPAIIKPVDRSGSLGVTVIRHIEEAKSAINRARKASFSGKIIIEKYVQTLMPQICGDGYMENSKIKFIFFGNGFSYRNSPYPVPFAESFPASHPTNILIRTKTKIEHILQDLGYDRGPFNFDVIIDQEGTPFILELTPRAGGNFIPTVISLQTGVDLVAAIVESAVNPDFILSTDKTNINEVFISYMIHSLHKGRFQGIKINNELEQEGAIHSTRFFKELGEEIEFFDRGGRAIGNIIMKFPNQQRAEETLKNINNNIDVRVT